MNRDELVRALSDFFGSAQRTVGGGNVVAVYLFGSRARGDNTAKSDVDLGLLLATTPQPGLDATGQILASDLAAVLRLEVEPVVLTQPLRISFTAFSVTESSSMRESARHAYSLRSESGTSTLISSQFFRSTGKRRDLGYDRY